MPDTWEERYNWLRSTEEVEAGVWGSILLSRHGILLSYDVEIAFCAGAWLSVIVLAHAAIDATLRDLCAFDYETNSKAIFGDDEDLQWLRKLRNHLVHVKPPDHAAALPKEAEDDASLETDAQRAAALLYRVIYSADRGT